MTKLLLALSAASICALSVNAKQTGKQQIEKMNAPRTAGKATGTECRLKAMSFYSYDAGTIVREDSAVLNYKPNFGWDHVLQNWKFDTGTGYSFDGTSYSEGYRAANTYDAQKRLLEQLEEEYYGGNWMPVDKTIYTYSTFGTVASEEYQQYDNGTWKPDYKSINTYNAQGQLAETVHQSENGNGTLENVGRTTMTYNTQGQLATETYSSWSAGQWNETSRKTYYYTGILNTIITVEANSGSGWVPNDSTFNTFDSKGNRTEQVFVVYSSGTLLFQNKYVYTYDANNNETSSTQMNFVAGAYVPSSQTATTFNNFSQPLTETYKTWDPTTSSFIFKDGDGGQNYYYELFENSVKDAVATTGTMRVHPMPASKTLNLNLNWNDAQTATVVLFDMTGKVAGRWTTPTAKQHTQMLDISNIPSGTYMLKVMGAKGTLSQQVNIVK